MSEEVASLLALLLLIACLTCLMFFLLSSPQVYNLFSSPLVIWQLDSLGNRYPVVVT